MTPQAALQRVIEHREIFHDEMVSLMRHPGDRERARVGADLLRALAALTAGVAFHLDREAHERCGGTVAGADLPQFATVILAPGAGHDRAAQP